MAPGFLRPWKLESGCGVDCESQSTHEIDPGCSDKGLLQATDRAARRMKRNRSALVREALREHLKRLEIRSNEERDRSGYEKQAQDLDASALWKAEAAWPAE